jgi:cell division septum initiation protein DivIVA
VRVQWLIERRLRRLTDNVRRAREELAVLDAQLEHFADEADYARTKAIVSDDPFAAQESFHAGRSADTMTKARADLVSRIARMNAEQDELLDRMSSS